MPAVLPTASDIDHGNIESQNCIPLLRSSIKISRLDLSLEDLVEVGGFDSDGEHPGELPSVSTPDFLGSYDTVAWVDLTLPRPLRTLNLIVCSQPNVAKGFILALVNMSQTMRQHFPILETVTILWNPGCEDR